MFFFHKYTYYLHMYQTQNKVKGQTSVQVKKSRRDSFLKEMLLVMIHQIFNATRLSQSFTFMQKCNLNKENSNRSINSAL